MTRLDTRNARRLLGQMGRLVVPLPSAVEEEAMVQRSALHVERLLGELAEQNFASQQRRRYFAFAAAALVPRGLIGGAAALFGGDSPRAARIRTTTGAVELSRGAGGQSQPAGAGHELRAGDTLHTRAGAHAALELSDRARVGCASETDVRLARDSAADDRLELSRGSVSFQVPKLGPGHTLSVQTRDALVTVRGTRFTVSVDGPNARPVTHVAVSEGRVQVDSVSGTVFLTAGQEWSSATPSVAASATASAVPTRAPATAAPAVSEKREASTPEVAAPSGVARRAPSGQRSVEKAAVGRGAELPASSTLREENVLYERALRRAQAGESSAALGDLEALMARHPRSPLVQNARVEHFRILLRLGNRSLAASEARRYLSDYPDGFARSEAKNVALLSRGDD